MFSYNGPTFVPNGFMGLGFVEEGELFIGGLALAYNYSVFDDKVLDRSCQLLPKVPQSLPSHRTRQVQSLQKTKKSASARVYQALIHRFYVWACAAFLLLPLLKREVQ